MLFIAVWLAQFASRQITRPVEALVTATGELAGGHLAYRVKTAATDELAALVASFNSMSRALEGKTRQLEASNSELARANTEIDERRRFIDAILESITPGVVSVDRDKRILKFNDSARRIAVPLDMASAGSVTELLDGADRAAFEHMFSSAQRTGIATRDFEVDRKGRAMHLGVTVSSLDSGNRRHGFVVVLEDTTEQVLAQKSEAWQEVARRLAHEIKNPLTPVALAAGRIDRLIERFETESDPRERARLRDRLTQSTRTIDREVQSLKALVDSFSDLARFPVVRPEDTDLNALVRDAVSVFEGRLPGVTIAVNADPEAPLVRIDPEPFKRVIVNLIDNAAEVVQSCWVQEIGVSTRAARDGGSVELTVADSGPGILSGEPGEALPSLLLHEGAGDRPRPVDRPEHRARPPRDHTGRGQPACGVALHHRGACGCRQGGEAGGGDRMTKRGLGRVLVVDDEPGIRETLSGVLEDEGYVVDSVESGEGCIEALAIRTFAVVLLDIWLPGIDGLETLERIGSVEGPRRPVVVMISGHGSIESAVRATKLGAHDFLEKPLSVEKVILAVRNAVEHRKLLTQSESLREELRARHRIIGDSVPMKAVRQQIKLMAPTNGRVLIFGESGTGKELVAHAIHEASPRSEGRFVVVNCAAIPEHGIESELFGHAAGALPGTEKAKTGKFQLADGGTLLLDEVGDMSLKTQAKVLRVVEEQRFEPVGSGRTVQVDVRVIAATNKNLDEQISKGNFREDLFYRLNVVPFHVPPLRDRVEDIPMLAQHFLDQFATAYGRKPKRLLNSAVDTLVSQSWPGNVRELRNLMERIVILHSASDISARHVPVAQSSGRRGRWPARGFSSLKEARQAYEREYVERTLKATNGNVTRAAEALGIERSNLHRKLKALGIRTGAPRE